MKLRGSLLEKEHTAIGHFSRVLRKSLATNLVEIRLFGSKANGMDSHYSDIDILIIVNEVNDEIKDIVFESAVEVNLTYDVVISPLIYSTKDYYNKSVKETYFFKATQKEGILL
jgi:uncharacterized protein